jgi:hypothetical protein
MHGFFRLKEYFYSGGRRRPLILNFELQLPTACFINAKTPK